MSTVAVVIPTIPTRKHLLRRALTSVFNQTRFPDQIIVEPDPEKTGSAATRNRANARVITDYVAVLDDDDEFMEHHVEVLMGAAEANPEADLLYSIPQIEGFEDTCWVVDHGELVRPWGIPWSPAHRNTMLSGMNIVPHICLMKTETVRRVNGYREGVDVCDDYDLFVRMLQKGATFLHVPEVTWYWRANSEGHTGGLASRW